MGVIASSVDERFWSKVDLSAGPTGCWEWQASRAKTGYGKFSMGHSRHVPAHRVAYELVNGPIPVGLHALHRCDNRPCVNPAHLFLGTNHDNIRDMVSKGRTNHGGEHNGNAKLDEAQVAEIIARLHAGERASVLAVVFGVTSETVRAIRRGQRWVNIPRPWSCA